MVRLLLNLFLTLAFVGTALAGPARGELLDRLLAIADADQVTAYHQLDLSPGQLEQLRQAAYEFLPRVEQVKGIPGGQLMLVPEAMSQVDRILTPRQRPLARKLVPRAHQWPRLKALFYEYHE